MGKITQYSRLSHHTIAGSASAGLTFSVPAQEDFTDGSWTPFDLALSEIGVNEQDKRVYIRIGDTIEELGVIGGSALGTTPSLSQVLAVDNQTLGNDIQITNGDEITGPYIQINGAGGGPAGSSVEIRHIDPVFPLDYIGVFIDDKFTSIHYIENNATGAYALNGVQLGIPKIEKFNGSRIANFILDVTGTGDFISMNLDDALTYQSDILMTTQSTLIDMQDLVARKQGKLEIDTNFCYFGHFDGLNVDLSYIQAQDDTITIQTQNSTGDFSRTLMDSSTYTTSVQDAASTYRSQIQALTQSIGLFHESSSQSTTFKVERDGLVHLRPGVGNNVVYNLEDIQTTDATPTNIFTLDVTGFSGSVVTLDGIVTANGSTSSDAYGAKLFGTFKYTGGVLSQVSTTDKSEKTDFTTATSDFTTSGTDIIIQVTGEASTTIDWTTRFNYQIL